MHRTVGNLWTVRVVISCAVFVAGAPNLGERVSAAPSHAVPLRPVSTAHTIGELDSVATTAGGVVAVGMKSLYNTTPPCGQALSERSSTHGWQAQYAGGSVGNACAWRAAIATDAAGGAWAVGYTIGSDGLTHTLTEHFNGTSWALVSSPSPGRQSLLLGVTVAPNHQVWAVGEYQARGQGLQIGALKTLTLLNTGSGWHIVHSPNPASSPDSTLFAVAASSSGRVWAVGYYQDNQQFSRHTLTMVYDSGTWKIVSSPSPGDSTGSSGNILSAITPAAHGGLWAVGSFTTSSHTLHTLTMSYGPSGWRVVSSPSPGRGNAELRAVVTAPNGRVWAVGSYLGRQCNHTLIEMNDGGSWHTVHSPNPSCTSTRGSALYGVAVDRRGELYAVGVTNITTLILSGSGSGWNVAVK